MKLKWHRHGTWLTETRQCLIWIFQTILHIVKSYIFLIPTPLTFQCPGSDPTESSFAWDHFSTLTVRLHYAIRAPTTASVGYSMFYWLTSDVNTGLLEVRKKIETNSLKSILLDSQHKKRQRRVWDFLWNKTVLSRKSACCTIYLSLLWGWEVHVSYGIVLKFCINWSVPFVILFKFWALS